MAITRRAVLARTLLVLAFGLAAGCTLRGAPVSVDPGVTVAAHQEGRTLVIDKLPDGRVGVLRPASIVRLPGGPDFALATDSEVLGNVWIVSPADVVVRRGTSKGTPLVGEIRPTWQDDVIRLTLAPTDGKPFRTDPFHRDDNGGGRAVLGRTFDTNLDLRGTYKAVVRDAGGTAVGWIRLRIGPYQPAGRLYDAVLPPAVDGTLGIASFVALGSEVDWIEDHTVDVYRGSGSGGLERSIPTTR